MKTKNTHGCYDHVGRTDEKAKFIAMLFAMAVTIFALVVLTITAVCLKQLNDQDKRTEYIEQSHSELK